MCVWCLTRERNEVAPSPLLVGSNPASAFHMFYSAAHRNATRKHGFEFDGRSAEEEEKRERERLREQRERPHKRAMALE